MSRSDVVGIFTDTKLPVIEDYYEDGETRVFPVLAYSFEGVDDFYADGSVYARFDRWSVSLYMSTYDDTLVSNVETAFANADVIATPSKPVHDRDENLWQQEWTFSMMRSKNNEQPIGVTNG